MSRSSSNSGLWGAWFLATIPGYLIGSMIGYRSLGVFADLFLTTGLCPTGPKLEGLVCILMAIAPAVWVAGIFVGIIQLSAWSSLVRLSRRSISRYALAWTGIMLMIPLLWIASGIGIIPKDIWAVIFLISGMALFYPAIAGAALLFKSPTKGKADRR